MTDRQFVLSVYPNAKLVWYPDHYTIVGII
jgi:hypothetical protein